MVGKKNVDLSWRRPQEEAMPVQIDLERRGTSQACVVPPINDRLGLVQKNDTEDKGEGN